MGARVEVGEELGGVGGGEGGGGRMGSLGVHISKVWSVTLDDWEPEMQKVTCVGVWRWERD